MNQCSILYIDPGARDESHAAGLRDLGFTVEVVGELPAADVLTGFHAVVVRVDTHINVAALGARLRARPRFGRRVLVALMAAAFTAVQQREATTSGFDVALAQCCTARDLAAHILRRLRPYPEFRCLLRSPYGRRKAA